MHTKSYIKNPCTTEFHISNFHSGCRWAYRRRPTSPPIDGENSFSCFQSKVKVTLVSFIKSDTNSLLMNSFLLRMYSAGLSASFNGVDCFRQLRKWNINFISQDVAHNVIDVLESYFKLNSFTRKPHTHTQSLGPFSTN